jgi:hypothetical protein
LAEKCEEISSLEAVDISDIDLRNALNEVNYANVFFNKIDHNLSASYILIILHLNLTPLRMP